MARIFITGSSDGLGSLAAKALTKRGHTVVLHGRNQQRATDAMEACPDAETALIADLSSLSETKKLAADANKSGPFDCVIHNAGLYRGGFKKTADGYPAMTVVNTMAPYILTCLLEPRPKKLVFLSSGLHSGGTSDLKDWTWSQRGESGWSDSQGYADTKLHNIMLAKTLARRWGDAVQSNSLDPGWVPTKMGGASAPGDLNKAVELYVMLAEGSDQAKGKSGRHWANLQERKPVAGAEDEAMQNRLVEELEKVTGVKLAS